MDPLTATGVIASLAFGVGGLIVGALGLAGSRRANALSGRANGIAVEANETARASLRQVELADARALEHHLVEWATGWNSRRMFWIRNDGRDMARSAFIRVSIDGEVEAVDQKLDVASRNTVFLQFDAVAAAWDAEQRARANHRPVEQGRGITFVRGAYTAPAHDVRVQIWWRTELGSLRAFENAYSTVFKVSDP